MTTKQETLTHFFERVQSKEIAHWSRLTPHELRQWVKAIDANPADAYERTKLLVLTCDVLMRENEDLRAKIDAARAIEPKSLDKPVNTVFELENRIGYNAALEHVRRTLTETESQ